MNVNLMTRTHHLENRQQGKQIILTSDRAPVDMQGMEQRLLSRFKWGLSADLQAPDLETRVAILNKKVLADGIDIPKEVLEYLAYSITTNIRELEGALTSLLAQSTLNKKKITLELAKHMIDKFVRNTTREVSIDYIQKVVCDVAIELSSPPDFCPSNGPIKDCPNDPIKSHANLRSRANR